MRLEWIFSLPIFRNALLDWVAALGVAGALLFAHCPSAE